MALLESERDRFKRGLKRLEPVFVVLAIALVLALIPTSTCLLRIFIGIPCPACGLTRAGLALAWLDVPASVHYHPLGIPLTLLTAVVAVAAFTADEGRFRAITRFATSAAAVSLLVVWAARFAGCFGGPVR